MPEITIQTATIAPLLTSTFHLNCPASPPAQTFYPSILNNKLFFQHQTHLEVNEKYLTKVLTKPDVIQEWWKKSEVKSHRDPNRPHTSGFRPYVLHIFTYGPTVISIISVLRLLSRHGWQLLAPQRTKQNKQIKNQTHSSYVTLQLNKRLSPGL